MADFSLYTTSFLRQHETSLLIDISMKQVRLEEIRAELEKREKASVIPEQQP